jgi:hypothetical protein
MELLQTAGPPTTTKYNSTTHDLRPTNLYSFMLHLESDRASTRSPIPQAQRDTGVYFSIIRDAKVESMANYFP